MLYLALDDPEILSPPLREDYALAEGVSEGASARLRGTNTESSVSRKSIFEITKSEERKQIPYNITAE